MESTYLFAACQPGSEVAAKEELLRTTGGRGAFSRPGLVTAKVDTPVAETEVNVDLIFSRLMGVGVGPLAGPEDRARLADLGAFAGTPHLFVFDRVLADDDRAPSAGARALEEDLRASGMAFADPGAPLLDGDVVVDVAVAPGEAAYVGRHVHRSGRQVPFPGGRFPLVLPAAAPSRAWLKIEEVLAWTGLTPRRGEVALDVGAAPGGASFSLLERGVDVVAIDPGDMAPSLVGRPHFRHLKQPVGALKRSDLPGRVDWILCDMNLAPRITLRYVERLQGPLRTRLRALVLTLKLVDERARQELSMYRTRVASWGYASVSLKQLACHRNEVVLVARNP